MNLMTTEVPPVHDMSVCVCVCVCVFMGGGGGGGPPNIFHNLDLCVVQLLLHGRW